MKPTMGTMDRIARIAVGLPLMVLGGSGLAGTVVGVLLVVGGSGLLITGMAEFRPLYRWLRHG